MDYPYTFWIIYSSKSQIPVGQNLLLLTVNFSIIILYHITYIYNFIIYFKYFIKSYYTIFYCIIFFYIILYYILLSYIIFKYSILYTIFHYYNLFLHIIDFLDYIMILKIFVIILMHTDFSVYQSFNQLWYLTFTNKLGVHRWWLWPPSSDEDPELAAAIEASLLVQVSFNKWWIYPLKMEV